MAQENLLSVPHENLFYNVFTNFLNSPLFFFIMAFISSSVTLPPAEGSI
jgi:hypothetical protein